MLCDLNLIKQIMNVLVIDSRFNDNDNKDGRMRLTFFNTKNITLEECHVRVAEWVKNMGSKSYTIFMGDELGSFTGEELVKHLSDIINYYVVSIAENPVPYLLKWACLPISEDGKFQFFWKVPNTGGVWKRFDFRILTLDEVAKKYPLVSQRLNTNEKMHHFMGAVHWMGVDVRYAMETIEIMLRSFYHDGYAYHVRDERIGLEWNGVPLLMFSYSQVEFSLLRESFLREKECISGTTCIQHIGERLIYKWVYFMATSHSEFKKCAEEYTASL